MAVLGVVLLSVLLGAGSFVAAMKVLDQRSLDRGRKTYRLSFPRELDAEQVAEWMDAVAGTLRPRFFHLGASPTIVLEVWATSHAIIHRLKVPWEHRKFIVSQLERHVPGIRVTPETYFPAHGWRYAVEVGIAHTARTLRIRSTKGMSTTVLSAVEGLKQDQAVIMQWVVTPAIPIEPPIYQRARSQDNVLQNALEGRKNADRNEVSERREKLEEHNMLAVLRVGARASTKQTAEHLVHDVRKALVSSRGSKTYFTRRLHTQSALNKRLQTAATPFSFPMRLSITELISLIGWPVGNPYIVGLPRPLGRQFPPPGNLANEGITIGTSTYHNAKRPVVIGITESMMHTSIVGETGTGKTALMAHIGRQVMEAGYGLIAMETEGNLYEALLRYIPKERLDDVILLDFSDTHYPVGFNVLDQGSPAVVIDEIMNLFAHRYGVGVWSDEYILHGMRTLAEDPGLTLMDLGALLSPTADEVPWVDQVVRKVKDPELKRWWQRHENRGRYDRQQRADPVLSRLSQMASRPELRHVLGQSKSAFQVRDVLEKNQILLVNLKGVSDQTKSLAATLLMQAVWYATKHARKYQPTYLLLDEFGDFMDLPINTQTMLAQARKHKLGMVLATQYMNQLTPSVKDGVVTNTRNTVLFTTNRDDANLYARELHGLVEPEDITSLQAYEAIVRVMTPSGSSGPISITTLPPTKSTRVAKLARTRSRERYGRPLEDVLAEMDRRHQVTETGKRKKPPISGEGWGG